MESAPTNDDILYFAKTRVDIAISTLKHYLTYSLKAKLLRSRDVLVYPLNHQEQF